jgi:hypothetical protein
MNKIILIFYVAVGNMSESNIPEYLNKTADALSESHSENGILAYYIPVRDEKHSRVECINPVHCTQDEYKKILRHLNDSQRKVMNFINGV